MNVKNLFAVWLFLLVTCSIAVSQTTTPEWFSVKGFLPEWNGAIAELEVNGVRIHKDTIDNDFYSYTGKTQVAKEGLLKIKKGKKVIFLPLFIEPGTIKIRDVGKKLVVYGTPSNDRYTALVEEFDSLALLQKQLSFAEVQQYKRTLATAFIQQHLQSLISLKLLADYYHLNNSVNDTLYYQLYNALDSTIKQSYTAKKLQPEVKQRYTTAAGRAAPLLELPDVNNEPRAIYETGKYTLLNFWASWCLPCRKEHPKLIQLYKQYKQQGFTIVSVSLDANRSAWLNAVKTEKLEWKQLSDLKAWNSPVTLTYGIKLIPYNLLLDPNGVIIAKNVNPDEIEALLAKKAGFTKFVGPF